MTQDRAPDTGPSLCPIWLEHAGRFALSIVVAVGTLWVAFSALVVLLAALSLRLPAARGPLWHFHALTAATFFLSGAVTMLFSPYWLPPAPRATIALRRVVVLASACMLFGFLAPALMSTWIESDDLTWLLSSHVWLTLCPFWLSWVAGGLAAPLLRRLARRPHAEEAAEPGQA